MAYFNNTKIKTGKIPIPSTPPYYPPELPPIPEPTDGSHPIIPTGYNQISGITLYQVTDENSVVNKTLSGGITIKGAIRNGTDIVTPIIDNVEPTVNGITYDLTQYNYCKIDFYDNNVSVRYYYMHVVLEPTNRFRLMLQEDVLMTFKAAFLYSYGVLSACEDERYIDSDLDDGTYINDCGNAIRINVYDNGFLDTPENILITVGVGGSTLETNAPDNNIGVLNPNFGGGV